MSDSQPPGPTPTEVQIIPPFESGVGPFAGSGRYELVQEIARGGMGVVYRARDRVFGRDVGVKTLRQAPEPGSVLAVRFREEARITGQLQHPNIPPVHDLGTLPDGRPFLAMKLIKGRTLDAELKERPTPAHDRGRFVAVFEQVAQGVAFAHAHGVVHRDLKPLNVMVGRFGEVQVMDWGLAKVLTEPAPRAAATAEGSTHIGGARETGEHTRPGSVFGTPAYMPREQAIGAVDQIDARSDVFSLGGVLCAILTGHPPYVGADAESTRQLAAVARLDDCFARLDGCGAEPELVALCKRCLAAERDARPRDAGEVAKAVAELRAEAERRARQAELDRVQAAEQRKRARVQLALVAALGLLALGGGAFLWWRDHQAAAQRAKDDQERTDRRAAEARLEGQRDAEASNRERLARSGVAENCRLATGLRRQYKFGLAREALDQAAALAQGGPPDLTAEVEEARRDLALVVEFDRIRAEMSRWDPEKRTYRWADGPPAYLRAFAGAGFDVDAADVPALAAGVRASRVRDELLDELDNWSLHDPARLARLLAVLRAADPDPWADRLRDPATRADRAGLERLARDADLARVRPSAVVVLAVLMFRAGGDAEAVLTTALTRRLDSFPLAFQLGLETMYSAPAASARCFQAALALRPDNLSSLYNLANALSISGQPKAAEEAFEEYIRRDPNYAGARYNYGYHLETQKQIDRGEVQHREAIRCDPTYARARVSLGHLLVQRGRLDEALQHARAALRTETNNPHAYARLGRIYFVAGDREVARSAWTVATRLDKRYSALLAQVPSLPIAPPPRSVERP